MGWRTTRRASNPAAHQANVISVPQLISMFYNLYPTNLNKKDIEQTSVWFSTTHLKRKVSNEQHPGQNWQPLADHQEFLVQENQPCLALILDTHPHPPTLWSHFLDGASVPSESSAPTGVVSEACAVRPLPRSQSRPAAGLGNKQKTRPASPNKCIPDPKAHILNPYDQIPPSSHTGEKVKIRLTSLQCISILPSSWTRE